RHQEGHWQAVLWRDLAEGNEDKHRAALAKGFFDAVRKSSVDGHAFPERISVFGISALPRFHMQVLAGLSSFTQVNLFLMNPCREYWGDILSSREIERRMVGEGRVDGAEGKLHLEKGNSLLASTGTLGRDFFDLINEFNCDEYPAFEEPGEGTVLSCLQSDILNLVERPERGKEKKRLSPNDRSLQIHSCHSPMRELEVLRDRLLDMFEGDPELMPKEILVMTPDVEVYAPYIQAVFDQPVEDERRIPYSIADRSMRDEGRMTETFLSILDLPGGRFGASEVLALLESKEVRRRLGLSDPDLDLVRRWVKESGIRWGIDAESRTQLDLPPFAENTWRAGLDRLLMGYAMAGEDEKMFGPVLPYDHMEGEETAVLGVLVDFAERLFNHVSSLARPKSLVGWSGALTEILECFFLADDKSEQEMQTLRRSLGGLTRMQELAPFSLEIDIRVIRYHLAQVLARSGFGYGFMTGGVTFCAMLPMRSIPFKVICLVGMNDDAYPRESKPLSFDLMAKHPRPGDRSRRHADRFLFLEALLSARERLYVSYVGQDIQDNSRLQPSVLVSELMDYLNQGFIVEGREILDHLLVEHRLQPFSPETFKAHGKLFSYSREDLHVARNLLSPHRTPVPFISKGLSEPEETWKTIGVEDLARFFSNPVKFLLNRRLAITLDEGASLLEDKEAFDLNGLDRYLLEEELLERRLEGKNLKDSYVPVKASGRLPPGTVGRCLYEGVIHGIEGFVEKMAPYTEGGPLEPITVDLTLQEFRVRGLIHPVYPERLVLHRYGRLRARDHLRAWIIHLVLNTLEEGHYPGTTTLVGLDPARREEPVWAAWEYGPVEGSREILAGLLDLYWSGLRTPLPLFPESSWTFVHERLVKMRSSKEALSLARRVWEGSDYSRGEGEDPYYGLCFREVD
ncbi:MAG: exodeoxyribonuclease V subunit gamma, partial [Desulfobacterales bacterium]|nr:exodeoxyribonuclease V subunit gamma [Desulfobacterales bacterium]